MPTYDYQCDNCDHEFEKFQSITANPLRKCPECGKMKLQRLIGSGAGIIFKGSGFYETDYRSKSYQDGAKAAEPKTESKDKTKSEVKPAKKAENKAKKAESKKSS